MLCVAVFMFIMGLAMVGAAVASDSGEPVLDTGSVLHLTLAGNRNERATDNPFATLMGNDVVENQGLDDLIKAIKVAKDDDRIKGIYIEGGILEADFASLQELRAALLDLKKRKKAVVAYADSFLQST